MTGSETSNAKSVTVIPENTKSITVIPENTKSITTIPENTKSITVIPENTKSINVITENTKSITVIPENTKSITVIPENTKSITVIPKNTKSIPVIPENTKSIPVIPENKKSISVIPENTKPIAVIPENTKSIAVIPENTKSIPVIPEDTKSIPVIPEDTKSIPVIPENTKSITVIPENIKSITVIPEEPVAVVPTVIPKEPVAVVPIVISEELAAVVPAVIPEKPAAVVPTVIPKEPAAVVPTVISKEHVTVVSNVIPKKPATVVPTVIPKVIPQAKVELDCAGNEITDIENYLKCSKTLFEQLYDNDKNAIVESSVDDFILHKTIGNGAFGYVMKVNHKSEDDKFLAMKVVNKEKSVKKDIIRYVLNEKRILSSMRHPFVIHMKYYAKDSCNIYFVMELATGGDLFDLITNKGSLNEPNAKFYSAQMVLALEYLHRMDIICRDLKPENVLVISDGYIKLADFGLSKRLTERTTTMCGTLQYLAPEIILSKAYGKPIDWWALGVVMFEIVVGRTPFKNKNTNKMFKNILGVKYKAPNTISSDLADIIRNLLQLDVSKRFGNLKNGTNDIKNHRWFKTIDWTLILNKKLEAPFVPDNDSVLNKKVFEKAVACRTEDVHKKLFEEF